MFEAAANWPVVRAENLIALIDGDKVNFVRLIEKTAAQLITAWKWLERQQARGTWQEQCRSISRMETKDFCIKTQNSPLHSGGIEIYEGDCQIMLVLKSFWCGLKVKFDF